jgi:hypothetical protein
MRNQAATTVASPPIPKSACANERVAIPTITVIEKTGSIMAVASAARMMNATLVRRFSIAADHAPSIGMRFSECALWAASGHAVSGKADIGRSCNTASRS